MKILNEDRWIEEYKPKPAPRQGNGFDFGKGCTLVTGYNDNDLEYLDACDPRTIWTVVDDGESTAITAGNHSVNRMGYIVTEKPWDDEMTEILLDDDSDDEEE